MRVLLCNRKKFNVFKNYLHRLPRTKFRQSRSLYPKLSLTSSKRVEIRKQIKFFYPYNLFRQSSFTAVTPLKQWIKLYLIFAYFLKIMTTRQLQGIFMYLLPLYQTGRIDRKKSLDRSISGDTLCACAVATSMIIQYATQANVWLISLSEFV